MEQNKEGKKLSQFVVERIMDRAACINGSYREECRDFCILQSELRKGTLILRWTSINIDDPDRPVQCYHYECFNEDGKPQHCPIHYKGQQEANAFFQSLQLLYKQEFASDHKTKRVCI